MPVPEKHCAMFMSISTPTNEHIISIKLYYNNYILYYNKKEQLCYTQLLLQQNAHFYY
jgi:hypothetical protein